MKTPIIAILLLILVTAAQAGTYLFGYTPGGALGGGLRFDLKPGIVFDLSASAAAGSSGSTGRLYGDVFWGNWGIGLLVKKQAVDSSLATELSLQYALEQPVNDKISLGVLLLLANYDTAGGADPNLSILPSIVPYFVLGF